MLTPGQQSGMVEDEPEYFAGSWRLGPMGMTRVRLEAVGSDVLEATLKMAWRTRVITR